MPPRSKDSQADAKAYALKLLAYRARSRKEMLERLWRKGFSGDHINKTMDFLEETGLINDELLASDLFRYCVEKKSLGKQGIRAFLIKRGIGRDLIEKSLMAHTADIEEQSALEFVQKKLRTMNHYPEDVVRRRLWGMLRRRGISGEVIRKVVNSVL